MRLRAEMFYTSSYQFILNLPPVATRTWPALISQKLILQSVHRDSGCTLLIHLGRYGLIDIPSVAQRRLYTRYIAIS